MKTQDEIVLKIQHQLKNDIDFFGVMTNNMLSYLDFDHAKEFLKDGITKKQWAEAQKFTDKDVWDEMKGYMEFAIGKAEDERGISANRSIDHYQAWSWLLDDKLHEWIKREYENSYCAYGMPILKHIKKWLKENKPKVEMA